MSEHRSDALCFRKSPPSLGVRASAISEALTPTAPPSPVLQFFTVPTADPLPPPRWSVFLQFFTVLGSAMLWIAMLWDFSAFTKTVMYFHIMSSVQMYSIAYTFVNA